MLTWYVVYWSALHLILDSEWIWYSLLLELKTPTLVRHCVYCVLTLSSLSSPSDENIQLEALGEEFELAEDIWWREHIKLWVLGQQDALALWGQWSYLSILFVWRFVWWDVSVLWGQYLHHRHRALWVGVYHLRGRHRCSFSDFDHRLQEQPYLYATLLYIVDWLLQWSKDYSDTTVFGWPTLTMSNRTFYSTLKLETWDTISMWKTDLKKELCVLTMLCIQKKVVQTPCVNHFVLEKLVSLWLMSWLFTFGWEPVCFENFWKCFDLFEFN